MSGECSARRECIAVKWKSRGREEGFPRAGGVGFALLPSSA